MRSVERPRVVILTVVLGVLVALALLGGGVLLGRASVEDKGPTPAQLRHATAATSAAKRELVTARTYLTARVSQLEHSETSWRNRAHRAERLRTKWRKRALRAERRARSHR